MTSERPVTMAQEGMAVTAGGELVGFVVPVEGQQAALRSALEGSGFHVEPLGAEERGDAQEPAVEAAKIDLDKECTVQDKEPCKIKVALGVAEDVAREAQLPSHGKLSTIIESGYTDTRVARDVLRQFTQEVAACTTCSDEQRIMADVIRENLNFPKEDG